MVRSLYKQHHRPLEAFIRRLIGPERAEDVVQEVFFRLLRLENLETRDISVSYLFRIGENLVRKGYHQEKRSRQVLEAVGRQGAGRLAAEDEGRLEVRADRRSDAGVGSSGIARVRAGMLTAALRNLTDNEQAAIRLIVCRGLSYEQAALALGVNVTTINNWKYRGVKKLQQLCSPDPCCRSDRGDQFRMSSQPESHRRNRGEPESNPESTRDARESTCRSGHGRGRRRFGRVG
ncbi:MAG: RNA polymerase sigma factor [Phycisphaera sp.]|nr:RNA polymerase sigma factor [Phycisphaera sp.]